MSKNTLVFRTVDASDNEETVLEKRELGALKKDKEYLGLRVWADGGKNVLFTAGRSRSSPHGLTTGEIKNTSFFFFGVSFNYTVGRPLSGD